MGWFCSKNCLYEGPEGRQSAQCFQKLTGGLPGSLVVKTVRPLQGAQVQSLVRKLRSHMLHGTAKKKKAERRVMWLDHTGGRVGVPPATQGVLFYLDFFKKINFIYLFIYGCAWSSLMLRLFSRCGKQGLLSSCGTWGSHCSDFSCSGARALGHMGFSSGSRALEHRLSSCGAQA